MTARECARPACSRPRDRGVHCRKCHRRWKIAQANARHAHGEDVLAWPAYGPINIDAMLDALIGALG